MRSETTLKGFKGKTLISFHTNMSPIWSESSLSAWRKLGSLATHWAHSEDSDQTGQMPRLIWVFAGHTAILLVLSRGGSYLLFVYIQHVQCLFVKIKLSNLHHSLPVYFYYNACYNIWNKTAFIWSSKERNTLYRYIKTFPMLCHKTNIY